MTRKTIAVDFDGTIASYSSWRGHYHLGKPIKKNVALCKKLANEGHILILFTTRLVPVANGENMRDYISVDVRRTILKQWLKENGLGEAFDNRLTGAKPIADIYFDDGSVSTADELVKRLKQK